MNRVLRCIVAPHKFLTAMDKAGIDLNFLEYPGRMRNILSDIDFQKYNEEVYSRATSVSRAIESDPLNDQDIDDRAHDVECSQSVSIDDIDRYRWADEKHLDTTNPLCNTDLTLFAQNVNDYYVDAHTAPLLYKIAGDGLLLVSLLQYDLNIAASKKLYDQAWYNFYRSLIDAKVAINKLAENSTFNYYINMTNG